MRSVLKLTEKFQISCTKTVGLYTYKHLHITYKSSEFKSFAYNCKFNWIQIHFKWEWQTVWRPLPSSQEVLDKCQHSVHHKVNELGIDRHSWSATFKIKINTKVLVTITGTLHLSLHHHGLNSWCCFMQICLLKSSHACFL